MDINICIDRLGLGNNEYALTQANTPHEITEWRGIDPQPTQAELEAAWTEYQTEYDSKQYQRDRTYPSLGDQLDMIYHAGLGGDEFQAVIKAVKTEFPKP
jgi:hypothetical protein